MIRHQSSVFRCGIADFIVSKIGLACVAAGLITQGFMRTRYIRDCIDCLRRRLKLGWVSFFFRSRRFFFMVASNLHINLFIKICSLLKGIYCSGCLQQKWPNQNPLSARVSRGRGPSHPYLFYVNDHHQKGCFCPLLWRPYCLHVLYSGLCRFQKEN